MRPAILVTDGDERTALAVVRSLGRAGYPVYVCATLPRSLAGVSRYVRDSAVAPNALEEPAGFVAKLRQLIDRWSIDILLPISEQALLAALPGRERLHPARIPFPESERVRAICDKARVLDAATSLGLAVPRQILLKRPDDRGPLSESALAFPVVVKPVRSVGESNGRRVKVVVSHAASATALDRVLDRLPPQAYPLLVQQRIVGPGVGIFLLLWKGEIVARFAHRRLREKPPAGGVSVYRESIAADAELVDRSRALLRQFEWEGVAMVEYKVDEGSGTPYLMEVNGRFWGSLQLAIDAGVDFPALLVQLALGAAVDPVDAYRVGVRSRWWWGDVDHLWARFRRSNETLGLPAGTPGRSRTLIDFLKVWRPGDRNEVLRWRDPRPFVIESANWLRRR